MLMQVSSRRLLALAAASLVFSGSAARAGYSSVSNTIQIISPPPSVQIGALTSDTLIRTFAEVQDLTLKSSVAVDDTASGSFTSNSALVGGTIAAGTAVDSYLFHSDTATTSHVYTGSVTFSTQILGLIVLTQSLDSTDAQLAHPGTTYSTSNLRGLELSPTADSFTLSADRRTLTFHFLTNNSLDEVRVVTAATVPEPASVVLMGLGGLILAGVRCSRGRLARQSS